MAARIWVVFSIILFCSVSREVCATTSQQMEDGKGEEIGTHPESGMGEPSFASSWLTPLPWELTKLLSWMENSSNDIEIVVAEGGVSDSQELQNDSTNKDYLTALLGAIDVSQVKISAYTAWNLMNDFNWSKGYSGKIRLAYDWYVIIDTEP